MSSEKSVIELFKEIQETQNSMACQLSQITKAFPNEDIDGHRRYHESVIEWSELRNKMVREALLKCAGAGAVAGAGYLIYAISITVKMYFGKGP